MPLDIEYHDRDNEWESSTDKNYSYVSAVTPKIERCIMARYRVFGVVPFGNRGWETLEREQDTPITRELMRRYTLDSIQWAIDEGLIRPQLGEDEVIVEVDDALHPNGGVGVRVAYYDVPAGRDDEVVTIPPWGKTG